MDYTFCDQKFRYNYLILFKNNYNSFCIIKVFKILTNNIIPGLDYDLDWLIIINIHFSDSYEIAKTIYDYWKTIPSSYP